jgi:hypothetical protein
VETFAWQGGRREPDEDGTMLTVAGISTFVVLRTLFHFFTI